MSWLSLRGRIRPDARLSGFRRIMLLTAMLMSPVSMATSDAIVLDLNGVEITQQDVLDYVKEKINPAVYESAITKPEGIANTVRNLYVLRRAHQAAISEGLVRPEELAYEARRSTERLAVRRFRESEIDKRIEAADWDSLAKEHYLSARASNADLREVRVEHILVDPAGRSFDELVLRVREVQALLASGERFSSLAVQFSDDGSVETNLGDLGFIKRGMTHPAFERAAYELSEKAPLSDPTFTSFGVHLIRFVDEREVSQPEFAAQKSKIIAELQAKARAQLKAEVFASYRKEVDAKLGELDEAAIADDILAILQNENN
jgi:hypothetical protein